MALLHASNPDMINEAAVAISYIAADNENQRSAIATEHGLEDLCYAVRSGNHITQNEFNNCCIGEEIPKSSLG